MAFDAPILLCNSRISVTHDLHRIAPILNNLQGKERLILVCKTENQLRSKYSNITYSINTNPYFSNTHASLWWLRLSPPKLKFYYLLFEFDFITHLLSPAVIVEVQQPSPERL